MVLCVRARVRVWVWLFRIPRLALNKHFQGPITGQPWRGDMQERLSIQPGRRLVAGACVCMCTCRLAIRARVWLP